jgi:polyvinyl alcohol dehydrogenase (cytochrome)
MMRRASGKYPLENFMMRMVVLEILILVLSALGRAQDGTSLFILHCATCHSANSGAHAPLPEVLRQMPWEQILQALETGDMKAQGATLTAPQRTAVARFAGREGTIPAAKMTGFCVSGMKPSSGHSWNGWGVDDYNTRFQPAEAAGMNAAQVPHLRLKWAFGYPNTTIAYGQPTIVAGRVYVGSSDGTVYSLDARTGCIYWRFQAKAVVRAAVVIGPGPRAYVGDLRSNFYALNADTGALIWERKVDDQPFTRITGTIKLHNGRLYIPVASQEENAAANVYYPCCTFRGLVVALDADTGNLAWKSYTTPVAKPTKKTKAGMQYYGPSGATVWSSPTLDLKRKLLYVDTGNEYSDPPVETADAIVAMDMETGAIRWSQQGSADVYNWNCDKHVSPEEGNCPENPGEDVDFGSSPILVDIGGGRQLLVAGQKSGVVHAVDPDQNGKIVWQTRIGHGSKYGGILWGMAANEGLIFAPLSDADWEHPSAGGGLFALDAATGKVVWHTPPPSSACNGRPRCSVAQMAPPTIIPSVVFSGAMDGHLRAYDTKDGKIIWDFDAMREFKTVNGVKARGGSFNATGPTVADGMLYVNSGYNGIYGNVLLVFEAK